MNHVDTTEELPTVLSFCSGYGGIERGLEIAGFHHRVIAYVEIESFAIANLVAKMESGELAPAPVWTNLKTFPSWIFRGAVDLVTGGYPCQPFSTAGKRLGAEDPRHLWPYIWHHVRAIDPGGVFFENVEGHISMGLSTVISDLEDIGYDTTWGIFSAAEVGAPHRRKRVFIRGERMGDPQHNGSSRTAERGIHDKVNPGRESEEQIKAREFAGTGRPVNDSHCEQGTGESQRGHCGASEPTSMADSDREGPQGQSGHGEIVSEQGRQSSQQGRPTAPGCLWPARPGQPQHGWEKPRTVKPGLGGTSARASDRVDRIRLLGNGVVPQTATKAWEVLSNE